MTPVELRFWEEAVCAALISQGPQPRGSNIAEIAEDAAAIADAITCERRTRTSPTLEAEHENS